MTQTMQKMKQRAEEFIQRAEGDVGPAESRELFQTAALLMIAVELDAINENLPSAGEGH